MNEPKYKFTIEVPYITGMILKELAATRDDSLNGLLNSVIDDYLEMHDLKRSSPIMRILREQLEKQIRADVEKEIRAEMEKEKQLLLEL